MIKSLSPEALDIIQQYLHLPFPGRDVSCPYYNNKRQRVRGALRVYVGKGSVEDIAEEAMILSLKNKMDLKNLNDEELKKFLVDHNIGIDCSGLAYYILDADLRAKKLGGIRRHLKFPQTKNPLRLILRLLRTVENTSASVIADDKNSTPVSLNSILPGDMITMINTGCEQTINHLLIIHEVEYNDANQPIKIGYTHSLQWSTDGRYEHGVRQGEIKILDPNKSLLEQQWTEKNKTNDDNETYVHVKQVKELSIKRLK